MENKAQGRYGWQEAHATASTRNGCTANSAVARPAPSEQVHGRSRHEAAWQRTSKVTVKT